MAEPGVQVRDLNDDAAALGEDAESVNDLLDQILFEGSMIAYSAARQHLAVPGTARGRT